MGLNSVACGRKGNLLMVIQSHINNEIHGAEMIYFFNIFTNRISFQMACIGTGANHILMVGLNGVMRRNAGHNRFHAAGITGKIMIFHIARKNTAVCFSNGFKYIHRCTILQVPI